MALIRNGQLVDDSYVDASTLDAVPPTGAVLVSLGQWQAGRDALLARGTPVGVKLHSDQHPQALAIDLAQLAVVALEFPKFRDGRPYTYARLLRERYRYTGELRAVGDVLQEQLCFMQRCGFDSFELRSLDPEKAWATVASDHSVFYQGTGASPRRASDLRKPGQAPGIGPAQYATSTPGGSNASLPNHLHAGIPELQHVSQAKRPPEGGLSG